MTENDKKRTTLATAAVHPRKKTRTTRQAAQHQMTSFINSVIGVVEQSRAEMTDEERAKADEGALAISEEILSKGQRSA